ncbi:P1 family peptidase [Deinococcus apachensis]|uniref:P1 family peptidase n=1 Tax=Deinococcus apachensis TaxID=309886 RepID=UPI00036DB8E8|nr:P1 family peptidase [Deinococcus apachensis]
MTSFEASAAGSQREGDRRPGPLNAITDVAGVRVGHHTDLAQATGTTVVLFGGGAVAAVDVRGAAPGTRETDLLQPENAVSHIHALLLSGGSAYGLDAAGGVMRYLEERSVGFGVGEGRVVPIVPGAVLFDLGRGGNFGGRPDASFGYRAAENARTGPVGQGNVGAGTGAVVGVLKGGVGTASTVLDDGSVVGALVALNAAGQVFSPTTGRLYAEHLELAGEFAGPLPPVDLGLLPPADLPRPGQNTTLGLVAVNRTLGKAQALKVAQMAQDGLPRSIWPVHTLFDGDVVFSAATGGPPVETPGDLSRLGTVAADTLARAVVHGVLNARTLGRWPAYREAASRPSPP